MITHVTNHIAVFLASTITSEDKVVPVGGTFTLTCVSSVSSNTMFSWTRNRMPVAGQTDSNGDTSTLTLTNVRMEDTGDYLCTVIVGPLVVTSNPVNITAVIIGTLARKSCNVSQGCYYF